MEHSNALPRLFGTHCRTLSLIVTVTVFKSRLQTFLFYRAFCVFFSHWHTAWVSAIQICLLLILLFFYPGTQFPRKEKKLRYSIQQSTKIKLEWTLLLSSFTKQSCSKMALYRWIRMESHWNKKLVSLSSPDWSASLLPSLERKTRSDALIRPNDSTATGWKMWWAWMFEYFAVLRVAASSAADPASRAAAATYMYESANGQITVTSQVSGFPASQGTRERPSGRFPSDRLIIIIIIISAVYAVAMCLSVRLLQASIASKGLDGNLVKPIEMPRPLALTGITAHTQKHFTSSDKTQRKKKNIYTYNDDIMSEWVQKSERFALS